jgi:DNA-binding XRE family transcriptional regulator
LQHLFKNNLFFFVKCIDKIFITLYNYSESYEKHKKGGIKLRKKGLYKPLLKIKARMVELGYTQEELAAKIKLSKASLNEKLNGNSDLRFTEIVKLTKVLGIPSSEINRYFFDDEL